MAVEESVVFGGEEREIEGFLALPESAREKVAGVVVIHEIWGLEEHIREVARRLAGEGYAALAPDLYTGRWGEVLSEERIRAGIEFLRNSSQEVQRDPGKLESELPESSQEEKDAVRMLASLFSADQRHKFARDLVGAVDYLRQRPEVERVGSIGFCLGGVLSGRLAELSPELDACVILYGDNPPLEGISDIHAPVLGLYGGEDPRITDKVPELAREMERAGKSFEYHVYPGAPHAFFNDTRPNYHPEASKDAWEKVLSFFRKHLKETAI